ncbi:hypothetical protein, partial [Fusibacillus kribbianus]
AKNRLDYPQWILKPVFLLQKRRSVAPDPISLRFQVIMQHSLGALYKKCQNSKTSIRSIRSFLKRRRMPMLNTERLKRRTKNFRWQNTIWSGS